MSASARARNQLKNACHSKRHAILIRMKKDWELYLLISIPVILFCIFNYLPLYGLQIAFKRYNLSLGIWGSGWVGWANFERFFSSYYFWQLLGNTLTLSVYQLIATFPIPIILALMMNEVKSRRFKKMVQTVIYMPHFISIVVLVGMMTALFSTNTGVVNNFLVAIGLERFPFLTDSGAFKHMYVWSAVWQNTGWSTVVYMAALAGVDVQQYEAASIDGASRLKKIIYITLPSIIPTAVILFIMNAGRIMNVGFEKVFLMQNPMNADAADVISTFVYNAGVIDGDYSFSTAVGLFNNVINLILVFTVNKIAQKLGETSLW